MAAAVSVDAFFQAPGPLLDVRSPGEYQQGHIPGATSFPLFSNQERAAVGTCYKQQGRDAAVELGLELTGPKLVNFVRQAKQLTDHRCLRIHCWRGGMRSGSMAWLMETAGFEVTLLAGGYKAFRRWVRSSLTRPQPIIIVGGMTGTGKTLVLEALQAGGEQVLDLEGLANHRGSSYGNLCLPPQPSTEQFENWIAIAWSQYNPQRPVWIEAESIQVGRCRIPPELFAQMERSPVMEIQRTQQERITLLESIYGEADSSDLASATQRIGKRLGPQRTQVALRAIEQGQLAPAIEMVLQYYDKTYQYDLERRCVPRHTIDARGLSPDKVAQALIHQAQQLYPPPKQQPPGPAKDAGD